MKKKIEDEDIRFIRWWASRDCDWWKIARYYGTSGFMIGKYVRNSVRADAGSY